MGYKKHKCEKCENLMKRLYIRTKKYKAEDGGPKNKHYYGNKPIGWFCQECENVTLD
jgi:hypothetical protein